MQAAVFTISAAVFTISATMFTDYCSYSIHYFFIIHMHKDVFAYAVL